MLTNYTNGGSGKQQQQQQRQNVRSESPYQSVNNQNNFIVNSKTLNKALQLRTKAENLFKRQLIIQQPSKHHCIISDNDDIRQEILKLLYDYYARIPLTNLLWNTSDVKQCLHDSMALLDHFDPYKAKQAFKLVASMLMNLINWPWLKEYHRIHTYGGLFKSLILSQLCQDKCINIFRRVGYQLVNDTLELTDFKCSQKSMDIVTSIIFDCLLAETTCQDIIDVYENSRLCKSISASKQSIHVNFKSWIKFYYRQRLDLLSDCSAFNIHNKLNSISLVTSLMNADNNHGAQTSINSASPGTSKTSHKQPKSNSKFYVSSNYLDDSTTDASLQRARTTIIHPIRHEGAFIDHQQSSNPANVFDVPHNDKEPLINRRPPQYRESSDTRRYSIYDNVSPIEQSSILTNMQGHYDNNKTRSLNNLKARNQDLIDYTSSSQTPTNCDDILSSDNGIYPRLWSCKSCTYNNPSRTKTCEMCRATREEHETMIKCPNCR